MQKKYIIEIINLSSFGTSSTTLYNIKLKVEEGQILGILGKNPQSLLTLFQLCTGTKKNKLGRFMFDGEDLSSRNMEYRLDKGLAVLLPLSSNFKFWSWNNFDISKLSWGYRKKIRKQWSFLPWERTMQGERSLREVLGTYELHKGNTEPKCLLIYQPFENLTPFTCARLMESFTKLAAKGCSILLFTSKTDNLAALCSKVAVLENGEMISLVAGNSENFADLEEFLRVKGVE